MKPMPVIRPSTTFARPSGECTSRLSLAWMNPQLAIATSGKVRRPALRARFSRSQPIGTASAKAAASATK
jgi:hypothetical protein